MDDLASPSVVAVLPRRWVLLWSWRSAATAITVAVTVISCGVQSDDPEIPADAHDAYTGRLEIIDAALGTWLHSTTLAEAQVAAEAVANLVVGPNGPGYGDRNGDGYVSGVNAEGVLPGLDGTPVGLAEPLSGNECVRADVLGGPWVDPAAEWATMERAIEEWRPNRNTMPTLASHPMRVVGWATFTLEATSVEAAHEYAGHARLHVDISRRAADC